MTFGQLHIHKDPLVLCCIAVAYNGSLLTIIRLVMITKISMFHRSIEGFLSLSRTPGQLRKSVGQTLFG